MVGSEACRSPTPAALRLLPLPDRGLPSCPCLASLSRDEAAVAMAPELRDLVPGAPPAGRLARDNSALRTFTFAEGVVMLVLGVLALIFPVLAS